MRPKFEAQREFEFPASGSPQGFDIRLIPGPCADSQLLFPMNCSRHTPPLPAGVAEWIERWVPRERRVAAERLFVNSNTGGPCAKTSLERAWCMACEQVGVRVSLYTGAKHSPDRARHRRHMRVWRICKAEHVAAALTGEGATL